MPSLAHVSIRPRKASRASRPAADLVAPGDLAADVVLGVVGVHGHVGTVRHHEEFVAVGRQQPVQGGEPGAGLDQAVQAPPERSGPARRML